MKKLIFLAFIAMCCSTIFAQDNMVSAEDLQQLEGNWRGTLSYYDGKKAKKDLVLKTELISEVKKGVLVMKFKYYDQNGEFTRKTEKLVILNNGTNVKDNAMWSVKDVEREGGMKLALLADTNANEKAMGKTISIKNGVLIIEKHEILGGNDNTNAVYSLNFEKLEHDLYR
ncbi:MAG: hypothetical protein HKO56_04910 [Bacteroidia bacterium]|nr:hypothetical protein [Bacteroidia bacterium]NNM15978.1 hypothetical protein [Bacteroidia bacterium]